MCRPDGSQDYDQTERHAFAELPAALDQAHSAGSLGGKPLIVVTAARDAQPASKTMTTNETETSIKMEKELSQAYADEISLALAALKHRDYPECFFHLERAHILGQRSVIKHTYAHVLMLIAGLLCRDFREVLGQVPRILASVLLSWIWVPAGNTGRARVSAIKPMPVPDDLRHFVATRRDGAL